MAEETKTPPTDTTGATGDPPTDDKDKSKTPPPATTDTPSGTDTDLKEAVREVLKELGVGRPGPAPSGPARRVDIESMAEQMVKEASAKLEKEKEQENRLAELEKAVKEKAEETPVKLRRSTKLMWGDKK